jgi:hypothetical protein
MKIGYVATAAASLVALTACGSQAAVTSSPGTPAGSGATSAAEASPAAGGGSSGGDAARCTAAELSASLGTRTGPDQHTIPLTFTNTSAKACDLYGVPGVDLHGPADPTFGPVYSLPRPGANDGQQTHVLLQPGKSASAPLTYLSANPGEQAWVPTELVTTPPGDTKQLTVKWDGDSVMRQDGATHPGTYVHAVEAP